MRRQTSVVSNISDLDLPPREENNLFGPESDHCQALSETDSPVLLMNIASLKLLMILLLMLKSVKTKVILIAPWQLTAWQQLYDTISEVWKQIGIVCSHLGVILLFLFELFVLFFLVGKRHWNPLHLRQYFPKQGQVFYSEIVNCVLHFWPSIHCKFCTQLQTSHVLTTHPVLYMI